jgi:cell division protein FtsX
LNILTQRIPDILQNFDEFGVDNPIPATLYVMFSTQEQYDALKTIIVDYRDIITNVSDVQDHATLSEQENRSLRVITIGRFVGLVSLFIVIILGVVSFLLG